MKHIIIRYLNEAITEEEEKQLLFQWLKESETNKLEFMEIRRVWCASSFATRADELNPQEEWNKLQQQLLPETVKPKKKSRWLVPLSAAASLLLLLGWCLHIVYFTPEQTADILTFAHTTPLPVSDSQEITLILSDDKEVRIEEKESEIDYSQNNIVINDEETISKEESSAYNQLVIPRGKRTTLTLPDGTKVWANAGTRLVYPVEFNGKGREIFVDGEIYLNVAQDAARPFIVKTANVDVTVLGTRFNVSSYSDEQENNITLVSGAVRVTNREKNNVSQLTPGDMYTYNKEEKNESIRQVDTEQYISWVSGRYIFNRKPLGELVVRLSRYYGMDIECDSRVASYLCSGKLNLRDNLEDVFEGLALSIPITYSLEENTYKIYQRE